MCRGGGARGGGGGWFEDWRGVITQGRTGYSMASPVISQHGIALFFGVLCIPKTCDTPSPPQIPDEYKNTFLSPISITSFLSALRASVKVALVLFYPEE